MRQRQLLVVEWEDISTYGRWRDEKTTDDTKPMICQTVGWKQKAKRGYLTIASSRNGYNECTDMTVIPKSNIREIRRIESASQK